MGKMGVGAGVGMVMGVGWMTEAESERDESLVMEILESNVL